MVAYEAGTPPREHPVQHTTHWQRHAAGAAGGRLHTPDARTLAAAAVFNFLSISSHQQPPEWRRWCMAGAMMSISGALSLCTFSQSCYGYMQKTPFGACANMLRFHSPGAATSAKSRFFANKAVGWAEMGWRSHRRGPWRPTGNMVVWARVRAV